MATGATVATMEGREGGKREEEAKVKPAVCDSVEEEEEEESEHSRLGTRTPGKFRIRTIFGFRSQSLVGSLQPSSPQPAARCAGSAR